MYLKSKVTLPIFIFILLSLALVVYWLGYNEPTYGIDDANIYFVYMRNFALGHGFVWNIGGEKVEGFTSLLWTLIGSFFYWLVGEKGYTWLLLLLNCIITYITVYRLLLFVRRLNNAVNKVVTVTDAIIIALLIFPLGFIEWSVLSLMETGLWIFLIVNLTISLCNYYLSNKKINIILFSISISAMIVTRPESILFGLLFIFIRFIQSAFEENIKQAIRCNLLPVIFYIITLTVVTLWRISYFGYPLPNTYYAKVSDNVEVNISGGLSYLFKFFYAYPQAAFAVGVLFISALVIIIRWKGHIKLSNNDKIQLILLVVILTGLTLPVLTGGDHFKFSRFYQCILPVIYAASLNFTFWKHHIGYLNFRVNRYTPVILSSAFIVGTFFIGKSTWYDLTVSDKITANRILGDFQHARNGRASAEGANKTFRKCMQYPSIGVLAAGGFCYIYKGNTIDLMGLNSTIMAHANRTKRGYRDHASFSEKAFWKLMPDVVGSFYGGEIVKDKDTALFILPENTYAFRHSGFVYGAYKEIFDHPRFISTYLPALVRDKENNFYFFAYYRKDFLNKLDSEDFDILLLKRKITPPYYKDKQASVLNPWQHYYPIKVN